MSNYNDDIDAPENYGSNNPDPFQSGDAHMDTRKAGLVPELRKRAMSHARKPEEEKQRIRSRSKYVMPETTQAQDEAYTKNLAQKEHKIEKSNRQIAKEVFGSEVYDAFDEARKGAEADRTVNIHHSRGNAQITRKEPVLEIDIAGSGFAQTWREHHGNTNWQKSGRNEGRKDKEFAAYLDQEYGKTIDGRKHTRQKTTTVTLEDGTKMEKNRITIAGPNALNNSWDDYNINESRQYAVGKIIEFLKPILDEYRQKRAEDRDAQLKDIHINLSGHSRGGVVAGETVRYAYNWLKGQEQYKDVAGCVKFDLVQRDPVPGAGDYSEHGKLDLSDIPGLSSTVVYSMSQQHYDWTFTPQEVLGADRVIFGVMAHDAALDGADLSQAGIKEDGMAHKRGFYDASTGEFYRGSGLSELPKGLYFTDEKLNLIRVDSYSQIGKLADAAFKGNGGLQKKRLNVLKSAAKDWFIKNDLEHSYGSELQREQSLEALERTKKTIVSSKDERLKKIQEGIHILNLVTKNGDARAKKGAVRVLRNRCREFMGGISLPAGKDEKLLCAVGDLLTGIQKEQNYLEKGLDARMDLPREREKTGEAERQLKRDEARMIRNLRINGNLENTRAQSHSLLKRLEAKKKKGEDSKSYTRLYNALKHIDELRTTNTLQEVYDAYDELEKASKSYKRYHRGVFSGYSDIGSERREVAKLAENLAKAAKAEFSVLSREIPEKDTTLDNLTFMKAVTVGGLQTRVEANAAAKEKTRQIFEGAKEAIGQEAPGENPSKVKDTDLDGLQRKIKLEQPGNEDVGKKPSKEEPIKPAGAKKNAAKENTAKKNAVKKEQPVKAAPAGPVL